MMPVTSASDWRLTDDNISSTIVIMVRTQISLSPEEYQLAKREAERQGISLAELLRRSLRALTRPVSDKPWMAYCGLVATGNPSSSVEIDELIYGQKS